MYKFSAKVTLVLAASVSASTLFAATPVIGVATSQGQIRVDSATSAGNTTIFDGNTLSTGTTSSQVRLKDGGQVRFDADSRGTIFRDHVDLQSGSAQVSSYSANANGLSVRPEASSSARVSIHGKTVDVAALGGNVHVFNASGLNVANLAPGKALSLLQDAGASAPSSLVGCAVKNKNNLLMTDETSNVVVQLRGGKVRAGKRIQVTGAVASNATAPKPATQVIDVTNVKEIGGTCKAAAVAAATGAGAAGAAGAGAGAGAAGAGAAGAGAGAAAGGAAAGAAGAAAGAIGATTAVVAGVAAAAAAGVGLAASGALTGTSPGTNQ
jgi:hypothetical protein